VDHIHEIPNDLSPLATSFLNSEIRQFLSVAFLHLLQRLRRLVIYLELALENPSLIKPTDNDLFIHFEHQLLSLPYSRWGLSATEIQECVRIATFVYCEIRVFKFLQFPFIGVVESGLREALIRADLDYFIASAPELLLWVLFIGSEGAKGHPSRTWYLSRLANVGQYLMLSSWEDARDLLKGFFYVDRVVATPLEQLWNEVVMVM
jgi:hypothetical protein